MITTICLHASGLLSFLSFFYITRKLEPLLQGRNFKNVFLCLFCGFLGGLLGVTLFIWYFLFTLDFILPDSGFLAVLTFTAAFIAQYGCAFLSALLLGFLLCRFWPVMAVAWSGCLASAYVFFHPHLFHWLGYFNFSLNMPW